MGKVKLDTRGIDIAAMRPITAETLSASQAKVDAIFASIAERGREACNLEKPGGSGATAAATTTLTDEAAKIVDETMTITHPLTGVSISIDDVDGLIDAFEGIKLVNDTCYATMVRIRETLAAMTEGEAKTRRIRGKRRQAKLEWGSDRFDQSILKSLANSHPLLAEQFLRIESYAVKMAEYRKAVNTSGPKDFEYFRDTLTQANQGPSPVPALKIET